MGLNYIRSERNAGTQISRGAVLQLRGVIVLLCWVEFTEEWIRSTLEKKILAVSAEERCGVTALMQDKRTPAGGGEEQFRWKNRRGDRTE